MSSRGVGQDVHGNADLVLRFSRDPAAGMTRRARPPLWAILVTLALTGLFVSLGAWQLRRAHEKEALQAAFDGAADLPAIALRGDTPPPDDERSTRRGSARGAFDPSHQILLDNQPREHIPGYHVWTPLKLPDGAWLIVDRGWVAADPDRRKLPAIDVGGEPREVSGFWRPLPRPALRLSSDPCAAKDFPRVASYPTHEQLGCVLGGAVADGVLLLDAKAADGYVREWTLANPIPPARHYGYAAQWFAFAATLLFLFFKFGFKRLP
jgi:cytochrome oxidase assembly protein ShyY1